jgi:hypothetical protein
LRCSVAHANGHGCRITPKWPRHLACTGLFLGVLGLVSAASAAPWRNHLTLPSGDEVKLRTEGLRVQASGSRGEIDVPVRVRFAKPLSTPHADRCCRCCPPRRWSTACASLDSPGQTAGGPLPAGRTSVSAETDQAATRDTAGRESKAGCGDLPSR